MVATNHRRGQSQLYGSQNFSATHGGPRSQLNRRSRRNAPVGGFALLHKTMDPEGATANTITDARSSYQPGLTTMSTFFGKNGL